MDHELGWSMGKLVEVLHHCVVVLEVVDKTQQLLFNRDNQNEIVQNKQYFNHAYKCSDLISAERGSQSESITDF